MRRKIYFAEWRDTPITGAPTLRPAMTFAGPAVIEQSDTTTGRAADEREGRCLTLKPDRVKGRMI